MTNDQDNEQWCDGYYPEGSGVTAGVDARGVRRIVFPDSVLGEGVRAMNAPIAGIDKNGAVITDKHRAALSEVIKAESKKVIVDVESREMDVESRDKVIAAAVEKSGLKYVLVVKIAGMYDPAEDETIYQVMVRGANRKGK